MEKEIRKIAIARMTDSLESDDRIRKEIDSIRMLFPNIQFKIFLVFNSNEEVDGVTSYGVPYKSYHLKSRDRYHSGGHLFAKTLDFYLAIRKDISDYDALWVSGDAPMPMLIYENRMPLVWDLRELPVAMINSRLKRVVLKFIFNKSRVLIHANSERLEYLTKLGLISNINKHYILRNYPDFSNEDTTEDEKYNEVKKWINGRTCVYLQGLSSDNRAAVESIKAIIQIKGVCAIILGSVWEQGYNELRNDYGSDMKSKIRLVGTVPILQIPKFMRLCKVSMIFYKNTSPNNYLCEPNRLYQAINVGLPVVVGYNPTLKNCVEDLKCGVVADTDGSDVIQIIDGLYGVLSNYKQYIENMHTTKKLIWNSQQSIIEKIIKLLQK